MSAHPFRTLDLGVRRRIDSLVPGDNEGVRLGVGSEREEVVRYQPGDDVRRIDWNITARSIDVHVWRPRADNQLDTWVLLDDTPSMAFGTVWGEKRDLATQIVWAVGMLTDAPGNRLGVATFGPHGLRWHRPDTSRLAAHRAGRLLAADGQRDGTGAPSLAAAIGTFAGRRHRPGLRVVISDFLDPDGRHAAPFDWQGPLRRLSARHDVIAVEVVDPRELSLPDVGSVVLVDPESGRQRQVWTADRGLRRRYEQAAAEHRAATAAAIRGCGAEHLPVSTGRDWVRDLARFVGARQRTRRTTGRLRGPTPMTFLFPLGLLMLLPVALMAAAYLTTLRRNQRYAVRFAALPLLDKVIPERPRWRRHLPAGLMLTAFGLVALAVARPEMPVRVPYERATIIVAIDTSESMQARDVSPDRLTAALAAAGDFIGRLPATFNVGVVTFSGSTIVAHVPDTDRDAARTSLQSVTTSSRTAIGEGVFTSLDQIHWATGLSDEDQPAHIVLLSDGSNTSGRDPGAAALAAAAAGVPVSTIAYGTEDGVLDSGGYPVPVPVDPRTLQELADTTGGTAYAAATSDELESVYRDIGSSVGWRTEWREVTPFVAALALVFGLLAAALSLRWFARLI